MGVLKTARVQLVASFILSLYAASARADEQIIPLAQSGDWATLQVLPSDGRQFCALVDKNADFALRSEPIGLPPDIVTNVVFVLGNPSWTLPENVFGFIDMKVNGDDYPLEITSNTVNSVSSEVMANVLPPIFIDLEQAKTMTVSVGHASPERISLIDTQDLIATFLTCANIPSPGGGVNPFSSSSSNQ